MTDWLTNLLNSADMGSTTKNNSMYAKKLHVSSLIINEAKQLTVSCANKNEHLALLNTASFINKVAVQVIKIPESNCLY